MIIETFVLSPFQQNTRILMCERTREAVCIDPGDMSAELVKFVEDNNLSLKAILLTHGHLDHVGGVSHLAQNFPEAEIILHKDDEDLYYGLPSQPMFLGIPQAQLEALGMVYPQPPRLTRNWQDGDAFEFGEHRLEARHCPGHTRGHIVLIEHSERKIFVGDCLFAGSIGRTDLPGGDHEQLLDSIERNILSLEDDFVVFSGHGPETTVGRERTTNPFLNGTYRIGRGRFV